MCLEECKYIVKEKKTPNYITEARKRYQNLSEENKTKCKKRPKKDIKISPKKNKKKNFSIIVKVITVFLKNKKRS